jgi:hypothetical protein
LPRPTADRSRQRSRPDPAGGILIDAVVVRCLLVPALVALFGRANWWLPPFPGRLLRVPAAAAPGRPVPVPLPAPREAEADPVLAGTR